MNDGTAIDCQAAPGSIFFPFLVGPAIHSRNIKSPSLDGPWPSRGFSLLFSSVGLPFFELEPSDLRRPAQAGMTSLKIRRIHCISQRKVTSCLPAHRRRRRAAALTDELPGRKEEEETNHIRMCQVDESSRRRVSL